MRRRCGSWLAFCAALLTAFTPALAHESPVDHVDRAIRISVANGTLTVRYQVQLSERAALMQFQRMDTNGDGTVSNEERSSFFDAFQRELCQQLQVELAGKALALKPDGVAKLLPQCRQVFTFSAPAADLKTGRHAGRLLDSFSRNFPGAYRWDGPKTPGTDGPQVLVAEAPKMHDTDGHPSVLQIKFDVVVP